MNYFIKKTLNLNKKNVIIIYVNFYKGFELKKLKELIYGN